MDSETLRHCIEHAKDRLLDDLKGLVEEISTKLWSYQEVPHSMKKQLRTFSSLMAMPDDDAGTLLALTPTYWKGPDDDFWLSCKKED